MPELRKDYRHLPMSQLRVASRAFLDELLTSPEVVAVYPEGEEQAFLAESARLVREAQAFAAGYSTSVQWLLLWRCCTFVGVCVEFVAAVAWLSELFQNPKQREAIVGYTQAFGSIGGVLVTGVYYLVVTYGEQLPTVRGGHEAWRYTLMSGLIPAIPLIIIRPFLPESPTWRQKKLDGTLKRPSIGELFQSRFRTTTIVRSSGSGLICATDSLTRWTAVWGSPPRATNAATLSRSLKRSGRASERPSL